jgi:RecJ-like exonuclease
MSEKISTADLNGFNERIKAASEFLAESLKNNAVFRVYSHLDADGLAAAGIVGLALSNKQAVFRTRILPWLDENVLNEAATEKCDVIIFTDLGSGYLDLIKSKLEARKVVILDHHPPVGEPNQNILQVNPHSFGIDGTREISGAGLSYLTMKTLDPQNIVSSPIAVVGALGDMQDVNSQKTLYGLNLLVVDDAKKAGLLTSKKDLIFFGHETRPIHKALARSMVPFVPGVSGSEGQSYAFLLSIGINPKIDDRWKALRDLTQDEKTKLASALAEQLLAHGMHRQVASLIGEVYTLTAEKEITPLRDGREFSTLLNATGRMNQPALGVSLCMGYRGQVVDDARKMLDEYRATIGKYLNWALNTPGVLEERANIYVLHGKEEVNDKMVSTIASALAFTLPKPEKPLLAYAYLKPEGIAKLSVRTSEEVVQSGIHLGEIIKAVAEPFKGTGGGHDIAAGAEVPMPQLELLIVAFDEAIGQKTSEIKSNAQKPASR